MVFCIIGIFGISKVINLVFISMKINNIIERKLNFFFESGVHLLHLSVTLILKIPRY